MDTKEIKITVPEGYEIDKENSTFECIKFKKKRLTYEDICLKVLGPKLYCTDLCGNIIPFHIEIKVNDCKKPWLYPNNARTKEQLQKILTLNKLMNVAEYLNGGWKPNWIDLSEDKYRITIEHRDKKRITVTASQGSQSAPVYFKTKKLAEQAIEILGEEEIKLAIEI